MSTRYEYNGLVGIRAIARHHGISESTLGSRLRAGVTMKVAVNMPVNHAMARKKGRPSKAIKPRLMLRPINMDPLWALALGMTV